MEAEAGAAACCEDEWGVGSMGLSFQQTGNVVFFCFFLSFPPPSSRDAALTRDQRLFLCACVKATKVNATSLGSVLHSHRMGVNGLLSQLNIP